MSTRKWYTYIPHPVVMLFGILLLTVLMSYILPAGEFAREEVNGRMRVIPGSYHTIESTPLGLLDLFRLLPLGFKAASEIIFVVLSGGIMFTVLQKTGMVENTVGTLVKRMGYARRYLIVVVMTFVYGMLGVLVGYENNVAMVPIAAVLALALGGDLMLAAGIAVGGITVGFGLSPVNPYTVGIGHQIAQLPMFSGAPLRILLCLAGLSVMAWFNVRYLKRILEDPERSLGKGLNTEGMSLSRPVEAYSVSPNNWLILGIFILGLGIMLYGIFSFGWYINEISAVFIMISIAVGLGARMHPSTFSETVLKAIGEAAPGAFMVGYATAIKVGMEQAHISDTIAYELSQLLMSLPTYASALCMSGAQCLINLLIPSGSGQALATLPIMIPLGDVVGITRQTTVLAFQIGDGVTNLFNPTLGGLIAMLSLARVPFDRWLRFIFPVVGTILLIAWIFLLVSVGIGWQ